MTKTESYSLSKFLQYWTLNFLRTNEQVLASYKVNPFNKKSNIIFFFVMKRTTRLKFFRRYKKFNNYSLSQNNMILDVCTNFKPYNIKYNCLVRKIWTW